MSDTITVDLLYYSSIENVSTFKNAKTFEVIINCIKINKTVNYTIGSFHINKLSSLFKLLQNEFSKNKNIKRNIKLIMDSRAVNFDISIIGLLTLFKNKFPNVYFEIPLPSNEKSFFRFRDVLHALNNWNVELTGKELYTITKFGQKVKPSGREPSVVFPILQINPESFTNYFVRTENDWSIDKVLSPIPVEKLKKSIESLQVTHYSTNETIKENNYRILKELIDLYKNDIKWSHGNSIFYKHYLKMLCYFDLAGDQIRNIVDLSKFSLRKHKTYGLSEDEMKTLRKEMTTILTQLNQQPILFNLLFSILAIRNLERKVLDYKSYTMSITELYSFTRNLFLGIREIARNIIEHTDSKEGILSARIYDATTMKNLKTTISKHELDNYISNESLLKNLNYFDIVVFDEGETGIVKKTIENVKAISSSLIANKINPYLEDVFNLENEKTILKDFYNLNDFKLNYHAIKASSHWGLIIFTNLINKNNGFTKVVTNRYANNSEKESCTIYADKLEYNNSIENPFAYGTYYNIVLPLDAKLNLGLTTIGHSVPKVIDFSTQNHIELLKYRTANSIDEIANDGEYYLLYFNIINFVNQDYTEKYRFELDIAKQIANTISNKTVKSIKSKFIPVLDFANCEDRFDQSKLLRLIGGLQLFCDFTSIIITNIRTIEVINLSETLSLKSIVSNKSLWNDNHFILIYSYHEKYGKRKYRTDIIGGSTYNDWNILRNRLQSTHSTYYTSLFDVKTDPKTLNQIELTTETKNSIKSSPLFIGHNSAVQNFELILRYNDKNLYEYAIEYILDKEISDAFSDVTDLNQVSEPGYRIADSHFKLGSKTHIKDFIYAKRLFQIGYYTNKFAFQVSQYIIQNIKTGKYKLKGNNSITLIGYAEYSQMLLNRIERILDSKEIKGKIGINKVNHDLLSDVDTLKFLKEDSIYENIIIIVPINTTFSTSIKIEVELIKELTKRFINEYQTKNKKRPSQDIVDKYILNFNFFEPFINIILVSHDDLNNVEYVQSLNEYLDKTAIESEDKNVIYPYKIFKWRKVSNVSKEVVVETNKLSKNKIGNTSFEYRVQKYFISVASKWYLPDTCIYCFPKSLNTSINGIASAGYDNVSIIHERALLETDKTSVTPNLLLELPQSFKKADKEKGYQVKDIWVNESSYKYGHFVHMDQHYLHFIEAITFFNFHRARIEIWAKECKSILEAKYPTIFQNSVLLISPSERNNTYFLEFVNRYIFDDSAAIIHYEVRGDYVENYQKFFQKIITQSDSIFYVDDFVKSGNTFHLVNDFVKYCNREYGSKGNRPCNGLISLISKADNFSKADIISLMSSSSGDNDFRYIAFHELNVYNYSSNENCPLCHERRRYLELADNSILDTVKHYFLNKVNKLSEQDPKDYDIKNKSGWEKFNPLIKDNYKIVLPWIEGARQDVKDLYDTFRSNKVPGNKYLKLLIENELNYLLSNDKEVQEEIFKPIADLNIDDGINLQKNKELLNFIIEKLKERPPFSKLIGHYNQVSINLFNQIFHDLVLKCFTLQPFVNIRPLREKSFSWVLIELHDQLNKLLESDNFDFVEFRRFKFLLRRATLLGSNYAIRKQTLQKIRLLFIKYTPSTKLEYEKKRIAKYELIKSERLKLIDEYEKLRFDINIEITKSEDSLFSQSNLLALEQRIRECHSKILFTEQALRNIEYKNNSLQEFNYFYVSLIKELLNDNESKVIKLEDNVCQILKMIDLEREKDFYYLLKLIQYENTIIVRKGLKLIVKEYLHSGSISFEKKFSKPEVRETLIAGFRNSMGDTRLASFKKFIGFDNFDTWRLGLDANSNCTRESFYHYLHLLYLLTILSNDEKKINFGAYKTTLENKTKTILQNIFRIACDPNFEQHYIQEDKEIIYKDNFNSGAFITLKFRTENDYYTKPDELFLAYSTKVENQKPNFQLLEVEIDEESLSYFMINGLCKSSEFKSNIENQKPRTILEFKRIEEGWQPVMSNITPVNPRQQYVELPKPDLVETFSRIYENGIIKDSFTENIFNLGNYTNYGLLRISKLEIISKEVVNRGTAVITFFSDNANGFDIDRLRKLMLLKDYLQRFIEIHYESDSISAFVNERIKIKEYEKLSHGFKYYLSDLSNVAYGNHPIINKELLIDILYDIIKTGPILQNLIAKVEEFRKLGIKLNVSHFITKVNQITPDEGWEIKHDSLADIIEFISVLSKVVVDNTVAGSESYKDRNFSFHPKINVDTRIVLCYSKALFRTIVSEVIVNAKKRQVVKNKQFNLDLYVSKDDFIENLFWFQFTSSSDEEIAPKKFLQIKRNTILFNTRGLGLIKRLSFVSTGHYPIIDFNYSTNVFEIKIPLKNIYDEAENLPN